MTSRTGLVGFWMSLEYSRYRSQVLHCIRGMLGQTELALAVTDVDEEFHWDHSFDRALRVPVEGIIAFDTSASIEAFSENYENLAGGTPFVSMGAYWSERQSFVGVDLRAGSEEAMDHLIGTGRRDIAYVAPSDSGLLEDGPRYEAYRDKMLAAGLKVRTAGVNAATLTDTRESLKKILAEGAMPEALLCMNDDIAISAVFALQQLGVEVGKDVAVVGFDGIEETEHCPCPITTVKQPIQEMCELTFQFLREQMENPEAPLQQKILKPSLVIRDSSRPSK